MSGRKGDGKAASGSSNKSDEDSIPEVDIFGWEDEGVTSPADWTWHRKRMSEWRERETDNEEDETDVGEEDETDEEEEGCALRMEEPEKEVITVGESYWMTVSQYRRQWDDLYSGSLYGSFEDTTRIPPMRFTDKPAPRRSAFPMSTVQLFSVKLAATRGRFEMPSDVFGMIAMRDPLDNNRNIVFQRTRDDCQTLTIEDPYLVLTGPTRAVMCEVSGTVVIEADLKVKGATDESEDECLGPLVMPLGSFTSMYSDLFAYAYASKLATLEFTLGHIIWSVEATIIVRVIHGSWPDGLRGVFAAFTTGTYDGWKSVLRHVTGIGHERIVLLDTRGEKLPITGDGKINLSRRVVSVETSGKLIVRVKALEGDEEVVEKWTCFHPLEAGSSISVLEFGFCKMEVSVFWSLITYS